jgi:peptide subunit release factor 1 (eRF1)
MKIDVKKTVVVEMTATEANALKCFVETALEVLKQRDAPEVCFEKAKALVDHLQEVGF